MQEKETREIISIKVGSVEIEGEITIPPRAIGIVVFAHGSGSSRFSPRNNFVAKVLQKNNLATFLVDLLTKTEDLNYELRFDIDLLATRLAKITNFLKEKEITKNLKIGYFGASTGAAAAVKAATTVKELVSGIVSRGGRVDLAENELSRIKSPILLIVGKLDEFVIEVNELAYKKINCKKEISIIPNATHLFEEPGTLEEVAQQTAKWFIKCFKDL